MRKINTFLLLIAFLAAGSWGILNAQIPDGYYKKYHINQNFDGLEALPTGWSTRNGTDAIFKYASTHQLQEDKLNVSGSGNRCGIDVLFPSPQSNGVIGQPDNNIWHVELDWTVNGAMLSSRNAVGLLFSGSNNQNLNDGAQWYVDGIFGLYIFGDGYLHYMNMDMYGPLKSEIFEYWSGDPNERFGSALTSGDWPAFNRAHVNMDTVIIINASTKTNIAYAEGKTYHILAELNFATQKVVKLVITDKDDLQNTQTFENHDFLAPSLAGSSYEVAVEDRVVTDLSVIASIGTRSSNAGNGNTANFNVSFDNIEIYYPELSLGQTNVTINYKDYQGNEVKLPRVVENLEISTVYNLLLSDKVGFTDNIDYFAYDNSATHTANADKGSGDGESVIVAEGASLDVIFKRTPITAGEYVWTGQKEFWNEIDDAFTTDGTNSIAYQPGNSVAFSKTDALIKEITLDEVADLGAGNLTVSAADYILKGTGSLSGTGTLVVNTSTTIGVINNLEGGVELNAGTLEITNSNAGNKYIVTDGTTLKPTGISSFNNAPIEGFGGTFNFAAASNIAYTSAISGLDTINYELFVPGRLVDYTYSQMPRYNNNVSTAFVNVFTQLEDTTAYFGTTTNYADAKVKLNDSVIMVYSENPPGNTTGATVSIGELSGTAGSVLAGAALRIVNYRIGGLNTDAVFEGSINPRGSGTPALNLYKEGKGTWTLTANSENWSGGSLYVHDGTLIVDGTLGSGASLTELAVADSATLSGNGYIATASASIAGALTGNLNFGGSVSFSSAAVMKIEVDGEVSDGITVQGDIYYGGKLEVTVKNEPTETTSYKIVDAQGLYLDIGDYGFETVSFPSDNWSFDWETGTLIYTKQVSVPNYNADKEIKSVEYFDAVGKQVSEGTLGVVIEKVTYTDGTTSTSKRFLIENR